MSSSRIVIGLAIAGIAAVGAIVLLTQKEPPVSLPPAKVTAPDPNTAGKPADPVPEPPRLPAAAEKANEQAKKNENVFIGRFDGGRTRAINTVLTTRKGTETFQGLIRYEPQVVPLTDIPGLNDVLEALGHQNRQIPQQIYRIDQETEALVDNIGESIRSITSYHAYINPLDWHIIAYDLAMTTGGQAQRFAGHLNKQGITVEVFRGGEPVDHHEIPFPMKDTFILPVQMEFVHNWYQDPAHKDMKATSEPVKFSVFIPEVMGFVRLIARPLGDQVIPVQDANQNCTRYEVLAISTQSTEGLQARQEMWFEKRSGLLMKREDFDPTLKPGEAPVMERTKVENLSQLRELVTPPPQVPDKPFPYRLDKELLYTIHAKDKDIGRLRIKFRPAASDSKFPDTEFIAESSVTIEAESASRHELATTYFNRNWRAQRYEAEGTESVEANATYRVGAEIGKGKVHFSLQRKVEEFKPQPGPEIKPELPDAKTDTAEEWKDPLVRVPVDDKEAEAQALAASVPRLTNQSLTRPVSDGTFLYDFNRVEQLATLAHRFPLPPVPAEKEAPQTTYQKAGIFSVRQNRAGVLMFEIRPEFKPVLTERQKLRLDPADRNEPQLFIANAGGALLPCRMLLTPDGRILELTTKHGTGDVTYTLDDPIMRRRAERAKKQRMQEGPQLIRPPWY